MTFSHARRAPRRRIPGIRAAALLAVVVIVLLSLAVSNHVWGSASSFAFSRTAVPLVALLRSNEPGAPGAAIGAIPIETRAPRPVVRSGFGADDGVVPNHTTAFDDDIPGVANLDKDLIGALRRAATDASHAGIKLFVESGWRSPEYQEQLLLEAISEYGSIKEAARWVATPETSPHVSGDAVDVGPAAAIAWLSRHGDGYGLCQIYRNEPWHFELRPAAIDHGCPRMYADPTDDPRMQP